MRGNFLPFLVAAVSFVFGGTPLFGLFFWARQDSTYWCILPYYGSQSPSGFYGYNSSTSSSTIFFQAPDTSFVFFYYDTTHDSLAVIYLHDKNTDPDGGHIRMEFDGLPSYIHMFQDDPTDPNDSIFMDHAVWTWNTCCTDGAVLSGFSTDSCFAYSTTIDTITGIREWLLISGNLSEFIILDTSQTLQLGCAVDTPRFEYYPQDSILSCDDSSVSFAVYNPLCAEMLFEIQGISSDDSLLFDSIVAVPAQSDSYSIILNPIPLSTQLLVVNPLLPCIPPETLNVYSCCMEYIAKFLCLPEEHCFSTSSCEDQILQMEIILYAGTDTFSNLIDTSQIYFTAAIQHPDTSSEIIYLRGDCGCFNFFPGNAMIVDFHSGCDTLSTYIGDGDMVTLQLDSLFTTSGCKVEFR